MQCGLMRPETSCAARKPYLQECQSILKVQQVFVVASIDGRVKVFWSEANTQK